MDLYEEKPDLNYSDPLQLGAWRGVQEHSGARRDRPAIRRNPKKTMNLCSPPKGLPELAVVGLFEYKFTV